MPKKKIPPKPAHTPAPRWLLYSSVPLAFIGIVVIGYSIYGYTHRQLVYRGVQLAEHDVSDQTYARVLHNLDEYETSLAENGLLFTYQDAELALQLEPTAPLIDIDTTASAAAVYAVGRTGSWWQRFNDQLQAITMGIQVPLVYTVASADVVTLLDSEFAEYITPSRNAEFEFTDTGLTIVPDQAGETFVWGEVIAQIETKLQQQQPLQLPLQLTPTPAPISTAMAEALRKKAVTIVQLAPITLTHDDHIYTVDTATMQSWLEPTTAGVGLKTDVVETYLDSIAGDIDIPVQEGRFSLDVVAGKVTLQQFQQGQNGVGVNVEKTRVALEEVILQNGDSTVALVVEVTKPRATPDNLADLGIQELLGTGTTNFAGSPSNRRYNIQKGADLLNGLLIAPSETFSLLSILSPIDLEHGWLSELVIKGDKLEKEAGGGLCQIGSTSFRAAMMTGLPIVERRNHSWAVSYYNYHGKAGVDATIYEPSPDFKFLNDTGHYILWRSRIEGNDIYFELWGTSDGRKGYFTEPVNSNYVYPGAAEEVIDESLPPGTRNCVQHAYTGVTAAFDYNIERTDGTVDTETFTSSYRARPERCLIGPSIAEADNDDSAATDTGTEEAENTTEDEANDNSNTNNSNKNTTKKKKNR